jgi:hypothetical protein
MKYKLGQRIRFNSGEHNATGSIVRVIKEDACVLVKLDSKYTFGHSGDTGTDERCYWYVYSYDSIELLTVIKLKPSDFNEVF